MKRIRVPMIAAIAASLGVIATAIAPGAVASPLGGQQTVGSCEAVTLNLGPSQTGLRLTAGPGALCQEVDPDFLMVLRTGGLLLSGGVDLCAGAATTVEADVTMVPAGRTSGYDAVHVEIVGAASGTSAAITMTAAGLPPRFVGAGHLVAGSGNTCSSATWTLGSFSYEDPTFS